jgi:hypothetical protein
MKKEQIFHPFNLWEDHKFGFYNNISGKNKKEMIQQVVDLFCNPDKTRLYMSKVVNEWYYSCQHNLTNPTINHIAYLGQAACCLCDGVPSTVTMEAWSKVPKDFQDIANSIAESTLSIWNQTHIKELVQKSSDNKC